MSNAAYNEKEAERIRMYSFRTPNLWHKVVHALDWSCTFGTRWTKVANIRYALDQYEEAHEPVPPPLAARVRAACPVLSSHPAVNLVFAASQATTQATVLNADLLLCIIKQFPRQGVVEGYLGHSPSSMCIDPLADALLVCRGWATVVAPFALCVCAALHEENIKRMVDKATRHSSNWQHSVDNDQEASILDREYSRGMPGRVRRTLQKEERERVTAATALLERLKDEDTVRREAGHSSAHAAEVRSIWRQREARDLQIAEQRAHLYGIYANSRPQSGHVLGGFRIGDRVTARACVYSDEPSDEGSEVPCGTTGTVVGFQDPAEGGPGDISAYCMYIVWDDIVCWMENQGITQGLTGRLSRKTMLSSGQFPQLRVIDIDWREMQARGFDKSGQGSSIVPWPPSDGAGGSE